MLSTDDRRRVPFWQPDSPSGTGMLRVEHEDRVRTTYSEHFLVVAVYEGAFDGSYRGTRRTHVARAITLKEPRAARRARRQDHARRSRHARGARQVPPGARLPRRGRPAALRVPDPRADLEGEGVASAWGPGRGSGARGRLLRREPAPPALPPHRRDH